MSALSIQVPFPVFQDRDGQPLDNGYVWIGEPRLNAQTNPVNVYFDEALTIAAAQPLRTINGYVSRSGSPAQIYVDGVNFSILVQDSKGSLVYNFPDGSGISPNAAGVAYYPPFTGALTSGYTVQDKLAQTVSVKDFGAVGDGSTDDTAAIQKAIDSTAASIYFPAGNYKISAVLSITSPTILHGDGPKSSVIRQTSASADGVYFNFPSLVQGGGVLDLSVESGAGWVTSGFQGSGSTGIGIRLKNSNGKFVANNYGVHNFDTSVSVNGCYYTLWSKAEHLYATTRTLIVDTSDGTSSGNIGAGNSFVESKYSNFGFSGTNTGSSGINLVASGGDFFRGLDATSFNNAVLVQPTTGKQVLYSFFDSVLADTCISDSWVFDGTNAKVWSMQCVGCWGAFSTNGAGLVTKGSNLDSVRWTGGRLRENGLQGWSHQGGLNVEIVSVEIAANSKLTPNTYDGVLVAANVSSWGIESCRIGNYASTLTGQANNIAISAGTSQNFRVIGNDLSNAGAGKVAFSNGSSSLNFVVINNLPIQSVGTNTSSRVALNGTSAAPVASGSTVFLGSAGNYISANANPFVIVKPGIVTGFYTGVSVAPGTGESFTFTVFNNGVATSMTGQISGNASFSVSTSSDAFTVAPNDFVTMRLVTSSGAALSLHFFAIYLEA